MAAQGEIFQTAAQVFQFLKDRNIIRHRSKSSSEEANAPTAVPPTNPSSFYSDDDDDSISYLRCDESDLDVASPPHTPLKKKRIRSEEDRLKRDKEKHPIRPPCHCKRNCLEKFDQENRLRIHSEYWDLDPTNRRRFVHQCIDRTAPDRARPRTRNVFEGRKSKTQTRKYRLVTLEGARYQVCKTFFMSTLGFTSDSFITTVCNSTSAGSATPPPEKRGRHEPRHKLAADVVDDICQHIESFHPAVPHYRRKHAPNRRYLPPDVTIIAMHKDFQEKQEAKGKESVGYYTYRKYVRDKNIAFTKLGEEECETCMYYDQHQHPRTEESQCKECQEWAKHVENARKARIKYQEDAKASTDTDDIVFVSSDMQKVILLPRMPGVKSCLFTRRLVVFHETFAPIGSKKSRKRQHRTLSCVWHEGVAGRLAADVASAFEVAVKYYGETADKIVFWADNCAAQNKNWTLFSMLSELINSEETAVREVELRFLEKGHTFMSADSFHAAVEKSMSVRSLYNMEDLVDIVEAATTIPPKVYEMTQSDFRNWQNEVSQKKKDITCRPFLSDIKAVKFTRGSTDMRYKLDMNEDNFASCSFRKSVLPAVLRPKRTEERGITDSKLQDIRNKLCPVMPPAKRLFWEHITVSPLQGQFDLQTEDDGSEEFESSVPEPSPTSTRRSSDWTAPEPSPTDTRRSSDWTAPEPSPTDTQQSSDWTAPEPSPTDTRRSSDWTAPEPSPTDTRRSSDWTAPELSTTDTQRSADWAAPGPSTTDTQWSADWAAPGPSPVESGRMSSNVKFFCDHLEKLGQCATFAELQEHCRNIQLDPVYGSQRSSHKLTLYKTARSQVPRDVPGEAKIPVTVKADGDCLPSCGSVFLHGHGNSSDELQLRIVQELALYSDYYLNEQNLKEKGKDSGESMKKAFAMYSESYVPGHRLTDEIIREIFEEEVMAIRKPKEYMGIWQMFGLASVLHMPIRSVYPSRGNTKVREHLNRMVHPRTVSDSSRGIATILWCTTRNDMQKGHWVPNHFVPLLPNMISF